MQERRKQVELIMKAIAASRSTWPSRDAAREYFGKRPPWKFWDSRVLDLYVVRRLREPALADTHIHRDLSAEARPRTRNGQLRRRIRDDEVRKDS